MKVNRNIRTNLNGPLKSLIKTRQVIEINVLGNETYIKSYVIKYLELFLR